MTSHGTPKLEPLADVLKTESSAWDPMPRKLGSTHKTFFFFGPCLGVCGLHGGAHKYMPPLAPAPPEEFALPLATWRLRGLGGLASRPPAPPHPFFFPHAHLNPYPSRLAPGSSDKPVEYAARERPRGSGFPFRLFVGLRR